MASLSSRSVVTVNVPDAWRWSYFCLLFLFCLFNLVVGGDSKEKRGKQGDGRQRGRGRRTVDVASEAEILFVMDGSSCGERGGGGKERVHQSWWF